MDSLLFWCGSSVLGIEFQVHARACECIVIGLENSASARLGLTLDTNPQKTGSNLETM